ncbi:hypothetical protein F2Q70_00039784 [Brassica cretica]|uniref:Single-stranded DNA binding protein Ssb-like OB fold domain-containing protein n=5 Tax=Brassica TaxID=3705 RepID=A0A8S9KDQ3_BRACR|nr:PREDICTED: uncharacterized protein At4g28440 [Brassica oleracea var. oleracea]XP_013708297.1 uncharacterized protein At4g28440 [Brassica napus]KAF2591506.1 hypothetical protein F2Q70_00039784 [Brassica cretica]KAG2256506.1 hypothetical protein Bca52824_075800 [Brassica carinata]VDD55531.1 unnamed protein product [Brassica oleracea]KAF3498243.1 hypothetical protein DY000_02054481 [Brassica cretica]KAH0863495.1 hypothetical protein HID58_080706 [Brassica napus]
MATTGSASAATGTTTAKRKPVFVKVEQLKPGTTGHTLTVKVVDANPVVPVTRKTRPGASMGRPSQPSRIAECLIGDETGCILFTARNDQVDLMKPGETVILRNSRIDMYKGTMRLGVDKWGRIEATEPASFTVKEDNNLSLVEYELINVNDR